MTTAAQSNVLTLGSGTAYLVTSAGVPLPVADLLDVGLEWSASEKLYYGNSVFAQEAAITQAKIAGKTKFSKVSSALIGAITGGVASSGENLLAVESPTAAASVTVVNGATLVESYVVLDSTGALMIPVASAPAVGQYVPGAAGVGTFTFAAGQTGTVTIAYAYSNPSAGNTVTISNQTIGIAPKFVFVAYNTQGSKKIGVKCWSVICTKLALFQGKAEGFGEQEVDFTAIADAATGKVVTRWQE
jgi:hypothetical protein